MRRIPDIGAECAQESANEIQKELEGANIVFYRCRLGGGTARAALPLLRNFTSMGALTIAVADNAFVK